jgi:hypothetical protein
VQFGVSFRSHAGRFDFPGQGVKLRHSISPAFPSLSSCPVRFSRAVIRYWTWCVTSPLFLRSPCTTDYTPAQPDRDLVLTPMLIPYRGTYIPIRCMPNTTHLFSSPRRPVYKMLLRALPCSTIVFPVEWLS